MKAFLKGLGIFSIFVAAGLYLSFLFLIPNKIDINLCKEDIQKIVKEYTNYDIEISNLKLVTTPSLQAGVAANDIKVMLPNKKELAIIPCAVFKISIPRLFLLDVRVTEASIYKPYVHLNIKNNKEFEAIKTVEDVFLEKEKNKKAEEIGNIEENILLSLIRINVPNVKIKDYRAYISDDLTGDYLVLSGRNLNLAYLNGKRARVKTDSVLAFNNSKNIDINIDVDSFIPKKGELDSEDDPEVMEETPFLNPVVAYKNYDPKGNISAKLKLIETKKGIKGKGFFNAENITLNIMGYKIPESYFKAKFKGNKTFIDSDLFLSETDEFKLYGNFKNRLPLSYDLNLYSNGVHFNDLILLSKAVLDSMGIQNNLNTIKGEGKFTADASVKTDSRKMFSSGNIKISDGAFINKKTGLGIRDIKGNILLDDNSLNVQNAGFKINDGTLDFEGIIDKKSNADFKITASYLPIPVLFNAFCDDEIKKAVDINSGAISLNATVKGKLKNPKTTVETKVTDLNISDKLKTVIVTNKNFKINFENERKLKGKIQNEGFKIALPYNASAIWDDKTVIGFDDKDITLDPTGLKINKMTALTFGGKISNYQKRPEFNFTMDGNLFADEIKALAGVVAAPFIDSKGIVPIKGKFAGNLKKQTLRVQTVANSNNFITPVHIKSVLNSQTLIQFLADFKGNRIKIKDTGLYSKLTPSEFTDDFELNADEITEIIGIEGTINKVDSASPVINLFRVNIPKPLELTVAGLKNSKMTLSGKTSLFGNLSTPRAKGGFVLKDVIIPDLVMTMNNASFSMNGKEAEIKAEGIDINGSDMEFSSDINLQKLPVLGLEGSVFSSNAINVDKLTEALNNFMKLIPKDPVQRPQADIPVTISKGSTFNIKDVKTGNIEVQNVAGNMALNNNIFAANNFSADIFKGKTSGDVKFNLLTNKLEADVKGTGMDADNALIVLANMKDTITGELSFDTQISLTGLTFEEQVKTLDGAFNFTIKDGQAGPFSKIENIFLSENLRESEFFKTAMGSVISSAVSVDTSRFDNLKGTIKFDGTGIAKIDPVTMEGSTLCIKVTGETDILENSLDAKVRGRLGSMVSSVLGPLANVNPVNIVKATPGLNVVMAKTFSVFCEKVSPDEMSSIPDFSSNRSDFNATKFQIVLRGDMAKPLTLLKSFKWLVTDEEYENAENFVSNIPETMPENVTTLEELKLYQEELAKAEAENKTLKGKIKNLFKKSETKEKV